MTATTPRSVSSRRYVRLAFALAAVMAAVAAPGCGADTDSEPLGALDLTWSLGPNSCDDAGLSKVRIELDDATMRETDCADGGAVVEDLEPGRKQLTLVGLDADGIERFAADPVTVTIVADEVTNTEDVLLSAIASRVDVTWYFTNGRLCSTNDVDDVELSVWRDGFLEGDAEAACDDGTASIAGLSSGTFVLELRALDRPGEPVSTAETELILDKGDRQELEVALAVED